MKLMRYALSVGLACFALLSVNRAFAANPVAGECDNGGTFYTHETAAFCQARYAPAVSGSKTRPANTTQYTANTGWADATVAASAWTFSNVCRYNGGTVRIDTAHMLDAANQGTKLTGTLYLFSATPTPVNDNTAFAVASADWANEVGQIDFTPGSAAGKVLNTGSGAAGAVVDDPTNLRLLVTCGASNDLYGLFKVTNTYTPISGEVLTIKLKAEALN